MTHPIEDFGSQINIARREKGISQPTLARMLGVSQGALRPWCLGERCPNSVYATRIMPRLEEHLGLLEEFMWPIWRRADDYRKTRHTRCVRCRQLLRGDNVRVFSDGSRTCRSCNLEAHRRADRKRDPEHLKAQRQRRARELQENPDDPAHGTSRGYHSYNCRCDRCREWYLRSRDPYRKGRGLKVTIRGETKNVKAWAQDPRSEVAEKTLAYRLRVGWDPEKALTTPSLIPRAA